ncbi:hypothetical protein M9H77_31047 [Catharanthus roseus]|uniref:Uncharacterized protein n=1 Tax=Catharanthus roseus TaxID=4058 RepID=A0ACB9ZYY6_CATRO|nr:hypothetical protein M9H77_31047 [Catharanthus roseus]
MVTSLLMVELLSIILMIAMRAIDLELEMVIMIELIIEFRGMKLEMKKKFSNLGNTSRPLSYNNVKLPLLCGIFGSSNYVAWDQNVESLSYSYGVKEEEMFHLVLKSLSYEVNAWWDCKCENSWRIGAQSIKTWSLIKLALRTKFGVENHEGQAKKKFMESSMGEKSAKVNEPSQAQDVLDRKVSLHHEKKNTCTFVNEEKSRKEKVKSVGSTKESEGKGKEIKCLIENHESLKEEHMEEKIQSQFFDFLITISGTKTNHGMKAKEEGMERSLAFVIKIHQ